jgi:hypothetical protein
MQTMPNVTTEKRVAVGDGIPAGESDVRELFYSLQGLTLEDTADLPKVGRECGVAYHGAKPDTTP